MAARRIHIIGGPGSGKSSAAARLAAVSGIAATDLDHIFWDRAASGYNVQAGPEIRAAALARVLAQPSWIIEGVYDSWLQPSFEQAELIVVMNTPASVRDWRILVRFLRRKVGLERSKRESVIDLWRLLRWNHEYDQQNLRAAREMLNVLGRPTVTCRRTLDVLRAAGYQP